MGTTQQRTAVRRPATPRPGPGPSSHTAALDATQRTAENFSPVMTALRWATTAGALLVLSTSDATRADAIAGAAVLAFALWRTVRPVDISHGSAAAITGIVTESAVILAAVIATGYWESPYVLGVFTVVSLAGFSGGIPAALVTAGGCVLAVALPYHLVATTADIQLTGQWTAETVMVAFVTGYARRVSSRASEETSAFMGRLHQLSEANRLLLQLHKVATTVPMSLDLSETLESSADQLREMFQPDVVVVLLRRNNGWTVARSAGVTLAGTTLADEEVLPALLEAANSPGAVLLNGRDVAFEGIDDESRTAVYAPLRAREVVGLLAVEWREPGRFAAAQLPAIDAFTGQMAVAIDNARWFSRIGTVAAEEERSRIARDLHDRIGQSLAHVGFELDRAARNRPEPDVRDQLLELRETVRGVVGELRETLYDLRTDVSDERDLGSALEEYLDRVRRRSSMEISYRCRVGERLPVPIEREIWRIAQEAITNAERHANASHLVVVWITDEREALLSITDDGAGMPPADTRRPDAYGLLGMQERADAIGASLIFTSVPGEGTDVRVSVQR